MGKVIPHKKIKLIFGFIYNNQDILNKTEILISNKYGPIDYHGKQIEFSHTDYYNEEFGDNLKRKFISLKRLLSPENIYKIKLLTNKIEHKFSTRDKRTINIDPGYLTLAKLVLLTTKDHSHRIYLRKGIFAESTLKFNNGTYAPWETTYPDYRSADYIQIFNEIREIYKKQL